MCGQHVRATAGDNTGQNTKDTPRSMIEIKIPNTTWNRTRAAGVGRQRLYRPRHGDGL